MRKFSGLVGSGSCEAVRGEQGTERSLLCGEKRTSARGGQRGSYGGNEQPNAKIVRDAKLGFEMNLVRIVGTAVLTAACARTNTLGSEPEATDESLLL